MNIRLNESPSEVVATVFNAGKPVEGWISKSAESLQNVLQNIFFNLAESGVSLFHDLEIVRVNAGTFGNSDCGSDQVGMEIDKARNQVVSDRINRKVARLDVQAKALTWQAREQNL
jgi:hypothetical protein